MTIARWLVVACALGAGGCGGSTGNSGDGDVTDGGGGGGGDLAGADLAVGDLTASPDLSLCSGASRACYSGSMAMIGVGACRAGIEYCSEGGAGPCIGEVLPSVESCNGIDDDCNGQVDDALGMITCGTGACQRSVAACQNAQAGACIPGAPMPETCGNNVDEDCDGVLDNGCGCVYVAPTGSDMNGTGQAAQPFKTIGFAIGKAGANGLPKIVCVASTSPTCAANAPSVANYDEAIVMRDGISVYGGYRYNPNGAVWTRVGGTITLATSGVAGTNGCTTVINAQNDQGVVFPMQVTAATALDGFTVLGRLSLNGPTAAITVSGSTGAIIENDMVDGGGAVNPGMGAATYGVFVDGSVQKATPVIRGSSIVGGSGTVSIGVRSVKSAPVIEDNCGVAGGGNPYDAGGRCIQYGCGSSCYNATVRLSIMGRPFIGNPCNATQPAAATETYGIRLEDSPGASVARNAVCSGQSQGDAAALRLSGAAAGTVVRANHFDAAGANMGNTNSVGLWADACAGDSPWVFDNALIAGGSRSLGARGDGVRVVGDCSLRVDSNLVIVGGEESAANDAYGVYCAADPKSGAPSRCTILNNRDILGSGGGFPPIAAGVRCDKGSCARIENNRRITAWQGNRTFGVILDSTGTFVARNGIDAGCGRIEAIGLHSLDSWARVENNVIGGTRWTGGNQCAQGMANAANSYAVRAVLGNGLNELELHSNALFALGTPTNCTSRALAFDIDLNRFPAPSGPRGVVRNNILHAGLCQTSFDIDEMNAAADPRLVENNDLWSARCGMMSALPCSTNAATALYRDEAANNLAGAMAVNGLTGATGNVAADPLFAAPAFAASPAPPAGMPAAIDLRTGNGSPCIDTGTSAGAPPKVDFAGNARPAGMSYDIGAFER